MEETSWRYKLLYVRIKFRHLMRAISNQPKVNFLLILVTLITVLIVTMVHGFPQVWSQSVVRKINSVTDSIAQSAQNKDRDIPAAAKDQVRVTKKGIVEASNEGKSIDVEIRSSAYDSYLKINGRKVHEVKGESGRGIHFIVINQFTGKMMSNKVYDTCAYEIMGKFLRDTVANIGEGRIMIFFSQDEATYSFPKTKRFFLKELGSRTIEELGYREYWIFVCIKKVAGLPLINELKRKGEHGVPLKMTLQLQLAPQESNCHRNPTTRAEERLAVFCEKRVGYHSICRCNNPESVDIEAPPLLGSRLNSVPIALLASYRPQQLRRTIHQLLSTPGVKRDMVTIFVDGFHDEISDVAQVYGLEVVEHPLSCTIVTCRISQHFKRSFRETFERHPEAKYAVILEEDLLVSEDIMDYFSQMLPLMEEDESVYCISAWNDHSYKHTSHDASLAYRIDSMPGLGWVLKKKIFKEWEPKWPGLDSILDWDIWTRGDLQRKGRECIIPDISRTYHTSPGTHVSEDMQEIYYGSKSFNHLTGVRFDRSKLTKDGYNKTITQLLKTAKVLDHSKRPCMDNDFIPNTALRLYVLFIKCQDDDFISGCETWLQLAKCFKIWDKNVRGNHEGIWRLWIKENHILFVSNLSPYFKHKPEDVVPLELEKR